MSKVWRLFSQKSDDLIKQLLINRGIKDREKFFHPKIEDYQTELEIPGIKKAKDRILKAIKDGEQIIVYGDYDVDGITASAIVYKGLTSIGGKVLPYLPHREKEGYGLSKIGLDSCFDQGARLVITVDHGIVALEMAQYAKELGLDLIITDHHLPLDSAGKPLLPDVLAIIHSTAMCGAAVAWCLIRTLVSKSEAEELLELLAIATVCDMLPLTGVNRALVTQGLKKLNQTKSIGLKALFDLSEVGEITSYTLGHVIGPRLNAIGRIDSAMDALRLLCTKDPQKARSLAKVLNEANLKRKELTALAIDEAKLKLEEGKSIHIISSKDWIPGIIGLVAARICEETMTPAIAISVGETHSRGSARSVDGINIVEVIRQCSDLLIDVGGHKGAAGFSLETKNLDQFKLRIEKILKKQFTADQILEIEAEVEVKKLTKKLAGELKEFEPFGFGNPEPLLLGTNLVVSDVRILSEGKHLKFKVYGIDCIGFGLGSWGRLLKSGQLVDLVYSLEINQFNDSENLQLKVKDLKIASI